MKDFLYKVDKKMLLEKKELVKFQLLTELVFFKKETLIDSDMSILTLLALWGPIELSKFCNEAAKEMYDIQRMEEFSVKSQNIRNRVAKLQKRGLISKDARVIMVASSINVVTKGNILVDYNFLAKE